MAGREHNKHKGFKEEGKRTPQEEKLRERKAREGKPKRTVYLILLAFFIIALGIVVFLMLKNRDTEKKAEEVYDELSAQTEDPSGEAAEDTEDDILAELGIQVPGKNLDWESLEETNGDIYAWLYVPGTNIDYPVLQHPEDDSFYLSHNLDGSPGDPGCIYTESANSKDFSDPNTVVYGHVMKDDSMFHTLHNFEDEAFFEENRYAFVYLPEGALVYDIYAAYEFPDQHLLNTYNFASGAGYQEYLDMVSGIRDMGAHFRDGIEVGTENHILTLSTCVTGKPDKRYLVQGVLVNDPALEQAE